MIDLNSLPLLISLFAVVVSTLSLGFAIYSWRQANRPIVTARITAVDGGNVSIILNLVVENTGNRPARDIRLIADSKTIINAVVPTWKSGIPSDAQRCLLNGLSIPILVNGRSITNAFEYLSGVEGPWKPNAEIPIKIKYRDLGLRRFCCTVRLVLADDSGFAQSSWKPASA